MAQPIKKTLLKKNMSMEEMERQLNAITKNDVLLSFSTLSSKQVDPIYRRKYLQRITKLFTLEELIKKWGSSKTTVCKFFINNKISIFEEKNLFEKELNMLLEAENVTCKEIRKRITSMFAMYSVHTILRRYKISLNELKFYCSLFGMDDTTNFIPAKNEFFKDIPENYTLILNTDILKKKEEQTMQETKTTVDITTGLVDKVEFLNKTSNIDSQHQIKKSDDYYKKPISIIEFLKLPENTRKDRITTLLKDYDLKHDEIEKILGIPSVNYFRQVKARHLIFDDLRKNEIKKKLETFNTFEECQNFILEVFNSNSYSKYKFSASGFEAFAKNYFGICKNKNSLRVDTWEDFCKKITKQAVRVYKNDSRVTNFDKDQVDEYDNTNRKVINLSSLIRITRETIKQSHSENQSWISIYDFKSAIEKEGFELDSNDTLIKTIDNLIAGNSFRNENFTLKKITLDNPILSDDSSIRWEFVSTKPIEAPVVTATVVKEETPVMSNSELEEALATKIEEDVKEEVVVTKEDIKEEEQFIKEPPKKEEPVTKKKDFINDTTVSLSFNEENIDEVIDFVKMTFKLFGRGNVTLNVSKT